MSTPSHPCADAPRRRRFTPDQKLAHLAAYEEACQQQEGGAYLRREGLYSSLITEWRRLRDAGVLEGKRPGQAIGRPSKEQAEIARLRRELDQAQQRLDRTETALEIYSRYLVGVDVHARETGPLAEEMMREVLGIHGIPQVVHADRGTSMTSKSVATLLSDLEVTRSHSRPKVSNDNPYSEANFKTLKYHPEFPDRFGSLSHAREFMDQFKDRYNHQHHHSGISLHTPADVHYGLARAKAADRAEVLATARAAHPERFSTDYTPKVLDLPDAAWINKPTHDNEKEDQPVYETAA